MILRYAMAIDLKLHRGRGVCARADETFTFFHVRIHVNDENEIAILAPIFWQL